MRIRVERTVSAGFALALAACLLIAPCCAVRSDAQSAAPPVAPVRPVTTDYFGITVADPYRYMENLEDPAVAAWFKDQNAYTRAALGKIPGHDALLKRIKELDESRPARVGGVNLLPGGRYFYRKTMPNEIVARLYVRDGLAGQERLLLDPEKYRLPRVRTPPSATSIRRWTASWSRWGFLRVVQRMP